MKCQTKENAAFRHSSNASDFSDECGSYVEENDGCEV